MRDYADLPRTIRRQFEERLFLEAMLGAQRARIRPVASAFRMADNYPAASDGVFTKFHFWAITLT
jgi:hypothetical protein